MKKILFFLFVLFFPMLTKAELIKDLKVVNGTLSLPFTPNNNLYSVTLNDDERDAKFTYTLNTESSVVTFIKEEEKTILHVEENGLKEDYVFYINKKEEDLPVFKEEQAPLEEKEIPHLKLYVWSCCFFIIVLLFKFLVL